MGSSSSLPGIIPEKKLKIWKVFSDPRPEGEEILKMAKLAHAQKSKGFIVTMADETYYFLIDDHGGRKITRIAGLCGVQVKGTQYKLLKILKIDTWICAVSRIYRWIKWPDLRLNEWWTTLLSRPCNRQSDRRESSTNGVNRNACLGINFAWGCPSLVFGTLTNRDRKGEIWLQEGYLRGVQCLPERRLKWGWTGTFMHLV